MTRENVKTLADVIIYFDNKLQEQNRFILKVAAWVTVIIILPVGIFVGKIVYSDHIEQKEIKKELKEKVDKFNWEWTIMMFTEHEQVRHPIPGEPKPYYWNDLLRINDSCKSHNLPRGGDVDVIPFHNQMMQ